MNETALKDRLKIIAKEKGISFNEIWKQFLLERFLARLSASKHHDKFIFKGGLLLAQYLTIGRETIDADFLIRKMKAETAAIEKAVREIVAINDTDGLTFSWSGIEELAQPHMDYPGYRVSLDVRLEKMRDKIQLDIGVGDLVEEVENTFRPLEYKGKPMFAGEISLLTYPVESIFAEKLETILSKGALNSRMKDYHDILLMIREPKLLTLSRLKKAVSNTFENRGSTLKIPISFESGGLEPLQRLWTNHIRTLGPYAVELNLPTNMQIVLDEINTWLTKHLGK